MFNSCVEGTILLGHALCMYLYCLLSSFYVTAMKHIVEEVKGMSLTVSDQKEPVSNMSEQSQDLNVKFHEAGWDSFCTGYCFIRMAHIYAHVTCGRYVQRNMLVHSSVVLGSVIPGKKQSSLHVCWLSVVMFMSIFALLCEVDYSILSHMCLHGVSTGITLRRSGQGH
jgi:hypothetical protein